MSVQKEMARIQVTHVGLVLGLEDYNSQGICEQCAYTFTLHIGIAHFLIAMLE